MTQVTESNLSVDSFAALQLPPYILNVLTEVGYETPSPIQASCIPILLAGQDILGEAQTGTGKTAAFALPILAQLDLSVRKPQALVLTPTRELAIQVAEAFQKYAHQMKDFHVLPVYGGQSMVVQLRALSRGAHVIVGTPGRIMDHLERKSLSLDALKTLVLDEADEMLRMGFIDDVEWILEHIPASRQTALFSATMPEQIRRIAQRYLREPQQIKIRAATATVAAIRQRYWQVRGADKLEALTRMLEIEEDLDAALIFVRTKTATVELAEKLEARGHCVAALNGDMTQGLREQVIDRLKSGSLDIVVATDVAARGLDVQRISHVINYDIPYDTEAYVHRIGRTGRAGRTGTAILFVAPREMRMLKSIEAATRQKIEPMQLPSKDAVAERRVLQFQQQIMDVLGSENLEYFYDVVRRLESEQNLATRQIAAALVFLAQKERPFRPEGPEAPATPNDRHAPSAEFKEPYRRESWQERPARPREEAAVADKPHRREIPAIPAAPAGGTAPRRAYANDGELQRYRIAVGRNHGATPKEIVGAIANEGGIEGRQIGQIHLFADFSTVELPLLPAETLARLKRTRVKQIPIDIRIFETDAPEPAKRPWANKPAGRDDAPWKNKPPQRPASPWEKPAEKKRVKPWEKTTAGGYADGGRPPKRKPY